MQVGAALVLDESDYEKSLVKGFGFYATLDRTHHWGGEIEFNQGNASSGDKLYERTYEIGPRYHRTYGPFLPYVKADYGRGVFNFPNDAANLAYNIFSAGGGVDVHVRPSINVRLAYEYQHWLGFPPRGLAPQLISFGVAYHFPAGLRRGAHY